LTVSTAVTVDVTEGFGALLSLRDHWERLFLARANEPSTSFEWTLAMAGHHVTPDDRCLLLQLRRGNTVVGIVPLIRRVMKLMGQRVGLLLPLSEQYNTHSDLLLASADDEAVAALVSALFRLDVRWDCFRMARLLEENPLVPALRRALHEGDHMFGVREGPPAYVLDLPDSFEAYLAGRSAKFRNHLKRLTRKLQEAGDVQIRQVERTNGLDEGYAALLAVERASWKEEHGTSITAVNRQTSFYRDLVTAALTAGRLHLQWLTLDGQPIAYNLGYLTSGGYHYLKTSYDHESRFLSPATYLRARLIESLISDGIQRFDFPGEPYEWEAQWTGTVRWRTVLSAYPRTFRGRTIAALDRMRHRKPAMRKVAHVDPRAQRAMRQEKV
jgi:CelD/BcsL family acetyltransferase involved in cellulose biosynthesis